MSEQKHIEMLKGHIEQIKSTHEKNLMVHQSNYAKLMAGHDKIANDYIEAHKQITALQHENALLKERLKHPLREFFRQLFGRA